MVPRFPHSLPFGLSCPTKASFPCSCLHPFEPSLCTISLSVAFFCRFFALTCHLLTIFKCFPWFFPPSSRTDALPLLPDVSLLYPSFVFPLAIFFPQPHLLHFNLTVWSHPPCPNPPPLSGRHGTGVPGSTRCKAPF